MFQCEENEQGTRKSEETWNKNQKEERCRGVSKPTTRHKSSDEIKRRETEKYTTTKERKVTERNRERGGRSDRQANREVNLRGGDFLLHGRRKDCQCLEQIKHD